MKRGVLGFLLGVGLLTSGHAWPQGTLLQAGPVTPGHVPMYVSSGSSQAVVQDSGPASGGAVGLGLSELLMVKRGSGSPPYANGGTGPLGTSNCMFDGPITSAAGYHYLCFDPNAQGGGLITYGAGGAAAPLQLSLIVNGTTYPFPFVLGGVVGPSTTVVRDVPYWNNTTGTLLGDGTGVTIPSTGVLTASSKIGIGKTPTASVDSAGPIAATTNYQLNGDIVITHPITPTPDNTAVSNITLGVGAGAVVTPIHSTQYLTLIGYNAGAAITTADHITAVGAFAMASFTSQADSANTALGIDTLRVMTSGAGNLAAGEHALASAVTSNQNTALGSAAQIFASGGTNNSSFGANSMQSSVSSPLSGDGNTAGGSLALQGLIAAATGNTALGFQALFATTNSNFNLGLGYRAGSANVTGYYNIFIGAAGITNPVTGNDNILIGTTNHIADTPASSTSNFLNIANSIYATGLGGGATKVGIGTSTPASNLTVAGNMAAVYAGAGVPVGVFTNSNAGAGDYGLVVSAGLHGADTTSYEILFYDGSVQTIQGGAIRNGAAAVLYSTSSDQRNKIDHGISLRGLDDLLKIEVRDFAFQIEPDKIVEGFFAQQLHKIYPEAVHVGGDDPKKQPWTVDYGRLSPLIIRSVQHLEARLRALEISAGATRH